MNWLLITATFAILFTAGWVGIRLNHFWKVLKMKIRFRRGAWAEDWARDYLAAEGYFVIEEQNTQRCTILVDGKELTYDVRIDYVVTRNGRTYGVEVKSGEIAVKPTHSDTRRQLLEYSHVYAFDGFFLADAERGKMMKIEFPELPKDRQLRSHWKWWLLIGFVAGVTAGFYVGQLS